jgi:hypothetical protein
MPLPLFGEFARGLEEGDGFGERGLNQRWSFRHGVGAFRLRWMGIVSSRPWFILGIRQRNTARMYLHKRS